MLNKGRYENHFGESFTFGDADSGVYVSNNTLRDYAWAYDSLYGRPTNFHKGITERTLTIVIHANSEEEGVEIKNRVFAIFDADVLAEHPGRFVDESGYYCEGYVIGSEKARWLFEKKHLVIDITFLSENPNWIRVDTKRFSPVIEQGTVQDSAKKYSYTYSAMSYTHAYFANVVKNDGIVPSDVAIRVYGPVVNPSIAIGPNVYKLNMIVADGEYVEINTKDKTIVKHNIYRGTSENQFWTAAKTTYIFQKVPVGQSSVLWNGNFVFEVDVIDERSEPPWT